MLPQPLTVLPQPATVAVARYALALLIPVLAGVAAVAFCGLLVGASIVQLTLLDPPNAVMPAVLIVVMVLTARDRREGTAALFARVRRSV